MTVINFRDAVDLSKPPSQSCETCRWKHGDNVCRRFPPVFMSATMVPQPDGGVALTQGGWSFPPAVQRCGEFEVAPAVN